MNDSGSPVSVSEDSIEALASAWLAQREEGFTPEQEAQFLRWRLADPRHGDAVDRLEQTCALLEQLPALCGDERLKPPGASASVQSLRPVVAVRRSTLVWLGGLAAAVAMLVTGASWLSEMQELSRTASYATSAQGFQRVLLPDSSVAQLNAATQLNVAFNPKERLVQLAEGEAHFNVTKDPSRPFVVQAMGLRVVAVGTAFNVKLKEASLDVLVTEGIVRVERESAADCVPMVLAAGESALVGPSLASVVARRVEPELLRATLAWQEPRLVFQEAPLADVLERFNAHNPIKLELADPSLGRRVVGGTFRSDDVDTFVRLLENGGDIVARREGDRIVLDHAH